jgi:hypothetical protein
MNGAKDCSKKVKDLGSFVIAGSAFAFLGGILSAINNPRPMGEMGHFMYASSRVMVCFGGWGLITGTGILRKWRWARISMLVFCAILVIIGSFLLFGMLVMPSGEPTGWTWQLILGKALLVAILFIPPFVGVRWLIYFTRKSVKSYFHSGGVPAQ